MQTEDYTFVAQLLSKGSGLSLGEGKEYLVESRLAPVAASLGLADTRELFRRLRANHDHALVQAVCEAMTTNESLFFRDNLPFEALKSVVFPDLAKSRQAKRQIRIWCAAASTGQEPYSIAMTRSLHAPGLADWEVEILATDLSQAALERARTGVFNHFEVQRGLPVTVLMKFFTQAPSGWQINESVKRGIVFRQMNLLEPFSHLGTFDVIFCRNVLIYFDHATKVSVLDRMARVLAPDGYLFLGGAETVVGIIDAFKRLEGVKTSVYRRAS